MDFLEQPQVMMVASLVCVFVSVLILVIGGQSGDSSKGAINKGDNLPNYCKEKAKCVDFVELDDIEDSAKFKDGKMVLCRCWRSKTFPYCDGSHNEHNKKTGDNVGPLILKKK